MARLRLAAGCCGSCSILGVLPCSYPQAARPKAQHHHRYAGLRSQAPFVARMYPRNGGASVMALQKRPGGVGQRWPRRAINSFQNLPEKQKRTRLNALLVFPGLTAPGWRLPRVLGYSIPAFLAGVRGGWRIPVWPGSSFLIDRSGGRMVLF